jgi:hypothetical protein
VSPGTDCWDFNSELNPGSVLLGTVSNALPNDLVQSVTPQDASLETVAPLDTLLTTFDVSTLALAANGVVYGNNISDQTLYEIDYQLVCVGQLTLGEVTPLPNPHAIPSLCGMTFGGSQLYGVNDEDDTLVELSVQTGLAGTAVALTLGGEPLDVFSCGMAWDCVQQRLILANGLDGSVYQVNPVTGVASLLAETDLISDPTGVEHDPASGLVYLASEETLSTVALDGSNTVETVGTFGGSQTVSNLNYVPACDP